MKYKVLIIDDELPIRKSLAKVISRDIPECVVVAEAQNGAEGARMISEHDPDIIITDIFMPNTDGLEMIARVRPRAKVIVITGFRDFEKAQRAIGLNVFDLLVKPINHHKFSECINKAISSMKIENLNSLCSLFISAISDLDALSVTSYAEQIAKETRRLGNEEIKFVREYYVNIISSMAEIRSAAIIYNGEHCDTASLKKLVENSENIEDLIDLFRVCVDNIIRNMRQHSMMNTSKHIKMAMEYIDNNYNRKLSLEEVSGHVNLSVVHLSRLFKKETGKTVLDYINDSKMFKAQQMLDTGKYKVYEIADELGFSNSHYFSTMFKKFTGLTPSEYLQNKHLQNNS